MTQHEGQEIFDLIGANDPEWLRQLVEKHPETVHLRDSRNWTPLMCAMRLQHIECLTILSPLSDHEACDSNGCNAISLAVQYRKLDSTAALLRLSPTALTQPFGSHTVLDEILSWIEIDTQYGKGRPQDLWAALDDLTGKTPLSLLEKALKKAPATEMARCRAMVEQQTLAQILRGPSSSPPSRPPRQTNSFDSCNACATELPQARSSMQTQSSTPSEDHSQKRKINRL